MIMGRDRFFVCCVRLFCAVAVIAAVFVAHAQAPAKKVAFDAFRLIQTRNIFDPDRRALASHWGATGAPVATPAPEAKPSGADFVALTGIMVTEDNALAFFGGSRADYDKVLSVKGSIAGATVTKITPANIEVSRDGKTIKVAVGQTIPFDGSSPAPAPVPVAGSAGTPSGNTSPGNAAPSGNVSETLRRMMERRQQELK